MIKTLLYPELVHFLPSLIIGLFLFCRYQNWLLIPACLLTGFFIDIDHLFDFWFHYDFGQSLLKMFQSDYFMSSQKVYILFHGWELLFALWWVGGFLNRRLKLQGFQWALCLPYFGHLLIDQFSGYTLNPLAYFLFYRFLNGFSLGSYH